MIKSLLKKSIVSCLLVVTAYNSTMAIGDGDEDKNFRFGIKVNPMLTWFRPDGKTLEKDGIKAKFGYGLITEFKMAKVISFATGIGGEYEGGKLSINSQDTVFYYMKDDEFLPTADTTADKYRLLSRSYDINYLNIPITLKMKTKDIGGMTYYAVFGGDLGIRMKSKVTDQVMDLNSTGGTTLEIADIDNTKDMGVFRTSLNVGGGFEYNLSGSTSFVVGLNYRRGFLPVVQKTSEYLKEGFKGKDFKSTVLGDGILLTLGILF